MNSKKTALLGLYAQAMLLNGGKSLFYEEDVPYNTKSNIITSKKDVVKKCNHEGLKADLFTNSTSKYTNSFIVQKFEIKALNLKNANKTIRKILAANGFHPDHLRSELHLD